MTSSPPSLENNLTLQILRRAVEGQYGILAQSRYEAQGVIALIRAAEEARSPAIAQLFPITMQQFGMHFTRFVIDACHAAKVPIAVHVDHAATAQDIERVLDWAEAGVAVDSIMIDCSHHDTDEANIAMAKPYCQRARQLGLAVEVELGRLAGGEAGVRTIPEGALTRPEQAQRFLRDLNVDMLAPSIGNVHGVYLHPPCFRLDLLDALRSTIGPGTESNAIMVLHGTDGLSDALFRDCIQRGCIKINVNTWARDPQVRHWIDTMESKRLPDAYEGGMEVFARQCHYFFGLLDSNGKA